MSKQSFKLLTAHYNEALTDEMALKIVLENEFPSLDEYGKLDRILMNEVLDKVKLLRQT